MKFSPQECPAFFQFYADYVDNDNIVEALEQQKESYIEFIESIPAEKLLFRYRKDKWTIKEVIGHNTDTERVKSSAALRIIRNDKAAIPGFDEAEYVAQTNFNNRDLEDLLEEFIAVRNSTIALFKSVSDEEYKRIGTVSQKQVSARVISYFLVGHISHHIKIIKERYLAI